MTFNISDRSGSKGKKGSKKFQTFDWEQTESVAIAVIETVAGVTETDPTELRPLASAVDTDALNTLFAPTDNSERLSGSVQFEYEGCQISVTADGKVLVSELSETEQSRFKKER